ncbi:Rab-GAP TBC domain-containing protein [Chloropicon roscoffensis]|uniref:Rab-GAP TBC domain-containing protein n=1 Tax=Chloropicon roscoffensis TaxID=1461544 RepID=A0AAX4P7L6_9CHLO
MPNDVTVNEKEFYAARMSLLDNMGSSDKKEMYRDINDLREEIVKILHEFGSVSDEKVQGEDFSLNQNLTELGARRAYKKGLDTGEVSVGEVSMGDEEVAESGDAAEDLPSESPSSELQGQTQQHSALGQLSRDWARMICQRVEQVASTSKAPLAANKLSDYFDPISPSAYRKRLKKVAADYDIEYQKPSRELFKQMGSSKSYYGLDMRDLMEYGCSVAPKCLPLLSCSDLFMDYQDLHPRRSQVGVDDLVQDSHYVSQCERGARLLECGDALDLRKFCRRGVPAELRARVWAASLGVKISVVSSSKKKWLASLHKKRKASKMLIERMVESDINAVLDSDHYFPFEDILKSTMLAFLLDDKVPRLCKGDSDARPKLYGFGESGESHGLYPPCGIIPFRGMSWYAAPLTFLFGFQELSKAEKKHEATSSSSDLHDRLQRPFSASQGLKTRGAQIARERRKSESVLQKSREKQRKEFSSNAKQIEDHARCYFFFRALYCRYFCKLHSAPYDATSGPAPSLLSLCQLFESLMEQTEPEVNYHLYGIIGVSPLSLAFPWIVHAFADALVPEQVLLLWDRVVGFDSLVPLVLFAVSIFHYRKAELLECDTLEEVTLFLSDLRALLVCPLLQDFVEHMGRSV